MSGGSAGSAGGTGSAGGARGTAGARLDRAGLVALVEDRYFGNVARERLADVVACFTEDAEVLIRHGDNPTRRFAARAAPGVPHISEFWRHLNANFDARFEHFSHVIDIEQQCSAATFVVTLAPKPASPYRERGTLTLQNCNFFWLRDGRIARMIVYYANPDSGGAAAGRPTGYGPPQG